MDSKIVSIKSYDENEIEIPLTQLFTNHILLTQQLKSIFKNIQDNQTTIELYELCKLIINDYDLQGLKMRLKISFDFNLTRILDLLVRDNNFPYWILCSTKLYDLLSKENNYPIFDDEIEKIEKLKEPYKEIIDKYIEKMLNKREYEIVQLLKQHTKEKIELIFHSKDSDIFKVSNYKLLIGVNLD